jgi:3',5'-cyclic AMP phosphodiesterase CpdA
MDSFIRRRDLMKMAGLGGLVFVTGLDRTTLGAQSTDAERKGVMFLQLTDTHIGFNDPKANPDFAGTLKKAVAAVNSLPEKPDFIVFTGDLSHTTDDDKERRKRLADFKEIVAPLAVKDVHYMPGEHDAGLDNGEAWHEAFGKSIYSFDQGAVHFIALDNVSDARVQLGDDQLQWLKADLAQHDKDAPIVVFTHRPLFDLYPVWDWYTHDGAKALEILAPYENVVIFYGHIHQINHHVEGHIPLHSGNSLMFPLPAAGSQPARAAVPWDPARPYTT